MSISEISVKRPIAMFMIVLIVVVLGVYALSALPVDMYPNMTMPMAAVSASYSGVAPFEMENIVTRHIENAVATTSNIKNVQSTTSEGSCMVLAEFNYGTNMDTAVMEIREKLDLMDRLLPDDLEKPTIVKMDPSMLPIATLSISKEESTPAEVKKFAEDEVQKHLEGVSGVASVGVSGGETREIQIDVDPAAMAAKNIGLSNVIGALGTDNVNTPGGTVETRGNNLSVRTLGEFMSLNDLELVPISLPGGTTIFLRDVAKVKDTSKEIDSYNRLNDQNCISLSIQKQSGSNTMNVMKQVHKELEKIQENNPDVQIKTIFDQSEMIEMTINNVAQNAVMGGILAVIILLFFLRSVRTTLVMAISIPTSIVSTFACMYFTGITLNIVSLGGLALGIGMLVDNSIVVLENITQKRHAGMSAKKAAIEGAKQVTGAVVASTLTNVVVFLPVVFVQDITGIIFKELALTITFSQLCSLLVTLLVVPALGSRLASDNKPTLTKKIFQPFENLIQALLRVYERFVGFALGHRKSIVAGALVLFISAICVTPLIGMEFMPSTDTGQISVSIEMPRGTLLDETDGMARTVEGMVRQIPEVTDVFTSVGSAGSMFSSGSSSNTASISLTLKPKEERKKTLNDVMEEVRSQTGQIAGAKITVADGGGMSMSSGGGVSVRLVGSDYDTLEDLSNQLVEKIKNIDGIRDPESSVETRKPEIRVQLDRMKLGNYGLTTQQASGLIKTALEGQVASKYRENGEEYDIRVQLPENARKTKEDLESIKLITPKGAQLTVRDIASIEDAEGPVSLRRDNQKRIVTVSASAYGKAVSQLTTEVQKVVDSMSLPDGYRVEFGGDAENMASSFSSLLMALLLSILLIYMVMAAQFESLLHPFIILFAIPFSLIGVVYTFLMSGTMLSVTALIGLIMLVGVVVNNAIVLIDFINLNLKNCLQSMVKSSWNFP